MSAAAEIRPAATVLGMTPWDPPASPGAYFVVWENDPSFLKIGMSEGSIAKRLIQYIGYTPHRLVLLGAIPFPRHEGALHRRFANQRVNYEWFRFDGPLLEYVRHLNGRRALSAFSYDPMERLRTGPCLVIPRREWVPERPDWLPGFCLGLSMGNHTLVHFVRQDGTWTDCTPIEWEYIRCADNEAKRKVRAAGKLPTIEDPAKRLAIPQRELWNSFKEAHFTTWAQQNGVVDHGVC